MHKAIAYFLLINIFFLSIKCQEQVPVNIRRSGMGVSRTRTVESPSCRSFWRIIDPGCLEDECTAQCKDAKPEQKLDHISCVANHFCDCYYAC
ncbi:hypothetical protein DCAR_0102140 [Daucus carota subsp. sativus]|uniref:Knottin scorpion toxin-like domain-containing protein n=1 Tax=Daucus carota subsp. sativus TaxID=79200 RepID=A0AAF1AJQ1_DAUCS|nr:hypothetical protein DCAR_0102140 [Daucus carota subsp. sativus]